MIPIVHYSTIIFKNIQLNSATSFVYIIYNNNRVTIYVLTQKLFRLKMGVVESNTCI